MCPLQQKKNKREKKPCNNPKTNPNQIIRAPYEPHLKSKQEPYEPYELRSVIVLLKPGLFGEDLAQECIHRGDRCDHGSS